MLLRIQRSQRQGGVFGGKIIFGLGYRAEYTAQEKADIAKYGLGGNTIFASALDLPNSQMKNTTITIDGLAKGSVIECQSIADLQTLERTIKESCKQLQTYLQVAESFDGREILVDFNEPAAAPAQAAE